MIADEVRRRQWDPHWRNELVLERDPAQRGDSVDATGKLRGFFHIGVRNRHRHKTATNCYVYLEKATKLERLTDIALNAPELSGVPGSLLGRRSPSPNARLPLRDSSRM